ncbi:MAG: sugar O-acetyltransferase, partial [Oscillospiraceae bacterium]|nr:sugar O-acetyltransferase [Oscillospiraceae bacterium]
MTETEKMLSGMIYDTSDKELAKRRTLAHKLS